MAINKEFENMENFGGEFKYTGELTFKVGTEREAWEKAREIFPCEYELDADGKAGYPVYRGTKFYNNGLNCWISDLTDRLEVNLPDGQSVNIWICPCYVVSPEYGTAVGQDTYNRFLANDAEEVGEEELYDDVNYEFGFDRNQIRIVHIVEEVKVNIDDKFDRESVRYARVPLKRNGRLLYAVFEVCGRLWEAFGERAHGRMDIHEIWRDL